MKNIFISLMLFVGIYSFSQEAGKAGELLKNEVSKNDIESPDAKRQDSRNNNSSNSVFRNPKNSAKRPINPNYQWNMNFGSSEVFLRIPEYGYFSVELGDQQISNNSGKYRFFDLPSGRIPLSIYDNGFLIYKTTLNVRNNSRLVLDFFTNQGLFLLDSYPIQNDYYGFNNWNDVWNNLYGNTGNNWSGNYSNGMNDNDFREFFNMMKKSSSFDDNKIAFINTHGRHSMFTSQQINVLVKDLSFDKNKLILAKSMFSKCVDKHKYYIVGDALDFEKSRRELMDFISKN
ncbi:hypothetical protein CHRY9390_02715 [Chryseobacterium aquaeductus]|uniref:DUF4476 domain-containing protein n=1 Tax=Chryseobacterium aquaeductus TaxID=2675056 RepID=A0A9N8QTE0_9FLAO|nr:DUF4476 domain-containing protein [Chryseobacterium aquaeductus]CAA7331994.1 hypothetical protein CHRY9390_02715 [Chryseobacterium potabilaquae]CAD7813818.1 hypothetical protein CHRY9390_02715 [Chryseobacterium aquaeductus]